METERLIGAGVFPGQDHEETIDARRAGQKSAGATGRGNLGAGREISDHLDMARTGAKAYIYPFCGFARQTAGSFLAKVILPGPQAVHLAPRPLGRSRLFY